MKIGKTETLTLKDVHKSHFGIHDIRIHQTGTLLSWKRPGSDDALGSAVVEISCRKPADDDYWLSLNVTEYAKSSSKQTMVTLNGHSAREIYKFLHEKFKGEDQT